MPLCFFCMSGVSVSCIRIVLRIGPFIIDSAFCILYCFYTTVLTVSSAGLLLRRLADLLRRHRLPLLCVPAHYLSLSHSLGISLHDFRFLNLKLSFSISYLIPFR